jgi:hypothetical protein
MPELTVTDMVRHETLRLCSTDSEQTEPAALQEDLPQE